MAKSIKNINKVLKKFKKFGDEAKKMVEQTTESNAKEIAADAKVRAPKDMGAAGLSGSIFTRKNTPMNYSIIANAKWAPYVEFGTGKQVDLTYLVKAGIPKSYAMQFKGKGIKEVNLPARPYFYPALIKGRKQFFKDLKGDLKHLINKNK